MYHLIFSKEEIVSYLTKKKNVLPYLQCFNLINTHAENKDIVFTHLFSHFNISSVHSTNSKGSIQLQYFFF